MPVPPTTAINSPGWMVRSMPLSTFSPVPPASYLKSTFWNSTWPLASGSSAGVRGPSSMEGSVSSTSLIRRAQAMDRESWRKLMPSIMTLIRIWKI